MAFFKSVGLLVHTVKTMHTQSSAPLKHNWVKVKRESYFEMHGYI